MPFRIVGSVGVRVRPDTRKFGDELRDKLRKEEDTDVKVPVVPNERGFGTKIRQVVRDTNQDLESRNVSVRVPVRISQTDLVAAARSAVNAANRTIKNSNIAIKIPMVIDSDQLADQVAKGIRKAQAEINRRGDLKIQVELNLDRAKATEQLKRFVDKWNDTQLDLNVNIDRRGTVSRQLALLARSREATIKPRIDKTALANVLATLEGLAGVNVLKRTKNIVRDLASNIDVVALSIGKMGVLIGTFLNLAGSFVAGLAGVGTSLAQLGGLALAAPAAVGALVAYIATGKAVFEGFKSAIDGDNDALEKLPKQAQEAALALRGTWTAIQQPTQAAFWAQMGHSLTSQIKSITAQIKTGMTNVGGAAGTMARQALGSFSDLAQSGQLNSMFDGMANGIRRASKGTKPLFDAINRIGLVGTKYMPALGDYLARAGQNFNRWIQTASDTGRLDMWFTNATTQAGNLKDILKGTVGIFGAISDAARGVGVGGLSNLKVAIEDIRKTVESARFQEALSTLFDGALKGMDNMKKGLGPLGDGITGFATTMSSIMQTAGTIVGTVLAGIGTVLSDSKFKSGLIDLFSGLATGISSFVGYLPQIASGLGSLASIAGTVFQSVLPVVGQGLALVATGAKALEGPVKTVAPILAGAMSQGLSLMGAVLPLIVGPLSAVARFIEILGPGGTLAAVAMLALSKAFSRFSIANIGRAFTNPFQGFVARASAAGQGAGVAMARGFIQRGTLITSTVRDLLASGQFATAARRAGQTMAINMAPGFARIASVAKTTFSSIGRGLTSAFTTLGPTAAIGLIVSTLAGMAEESRKFQQSMEQAYAAAQNIAKLKYENPLGLEGGKQAGTDEANAAIDALVAKMKAAGQDISQITGNRQGLIDAFIGNNTDGAKSAISTLDKLQSTFDGMDSTSFARSVNVFGHGNTTADKLHEITNGIAAFKGTAEAATGATDGLATSVDANLKRNVNAATRVIEQFGTVSVDSIEKVPGAFRGLGGESQDALTNFATFISQSLGGSADVINDRVPEITAGLRTVGDSPKEIARFMTGLGYSTRDITTVLTSIGEGTDAAAEDIKFSMGVVTNSVGGAIKVMGQDIPKLRSTSDGMVELADALSAVTKVDSKTLLGVFTQYGTQGNEVAAGLKAAGVGFDDIRGVLQALGLPASTAALALSQVVDAANKASIGNAWDAGAAAKYGLALGEINTGADDAATKVGKLRDAIDLLNGGTLSTQRILSSFNESVEAVRKTALGVPKGFDWGTVVGKNGALSLATEQGRGLFSVLDDLSTNALTAAQDAFEKTYAKTGNYAQSLGAAKKATEGQIASTTALLTSLGLTNTQVEGVLTTMGLIPSKIATDVAVTTAGANSQLGHTLGLLNNIKPGATANVGVLDSLARTKLESLGVKLKVLADGTYEATLSADDHKGRAQIDAFAVWVAQQNFQASLNVSVTVDPILDAVNRARRAAGLGDMAANGGIRIGGKWDASFGKGGPQFEIASALKGLGKVNAKLQTFANGGITSKPTSAHIAKASSYVMYAEKETGGEAFIPLSPFKRGRSTQILADVARRFGLELTAKQSRLRKYSDGGVTTTDAGSGKSVAFTITNNYPQAEPASRTEAAAMKLAADIGAI